MRKFYLWVSTSLLSGLALIIVWGCDKVYVLNKMYSSAIVDEAGWAHCYAQILDNEKLSDSEKLSKLQLTSSVELPPLIAQLDSLGTSDTNALKVESQLIDLKNHK
jgi:hypothetical protein